MANITLNYDNFDKQCSEMIEFSTILRYTKVEKLVREQNRVLQDYETFLFLFTHLMRLYSSKMLTITITFKFFFSNIIVVDYRARGVVTVGLSSVSSVGTL